MTTITKERIELFIKNPLENGLTRGEQMELARIAMASLEAEPIGAFHIADQQVGGTSDYIKDGEWPIDNGVIDVYAVPPVQETGVYNDVFNIIGLLKKNEWAEHCTSTVLGSLLESEITRLVGKEQPAPERNRIRREHAEWSDKTFGDVGHIGPLKHLSKEALEAAADPSDPLEWADMQFLLWDAQRRMGISDEFVTRAMIEKLEINKSRQWPEPKDGEPRLHIKEQSAPVIPDGWINCSERMPEQGAYISAVSKHGEYVAGQVIDDWLDLHDGTSFGLDEVYLWMMLPPLPASPQQ